MQQTFPRLFLGSLTCSSAFCITDMHQHQEMLSEGEECKRQRGRKPGRPQQPPCALVLKENSWLSPSALPASSIGRALLGERHGCTPVLSTHHRQVDTEELHHSGTSVWDSQFACPSDPSAGGGGGLHVCIVRRCSL